MSLFNGDTGRHIPEPEWPVILCQQLGWALARIWCWREFSLPALVVLGVYAGHRPELALVLVLVGVSVVLSLLLWRPGLIVGAFRSCRARSRALSRQIAWPRMCEGLGWSRRLPSGGRLVPSLVAWAEDEYQVRIVIRPLAEHSQSSWDHMADALRRYVCGETVQWRESRGNLAVVVSRHGLPTKLTWASGLSDTERLALGQRHGGALLALDVLRTPHVLLAGATGSGKGGTIRAALAGALEAGWQVVVVDPKESGEYFWLDRLGVPVVTHLPDEVQALQTIDAIRQARQTAIKRYGADTWRELPEHARPGWRPILVVIDEAADLLVTVKGRGEPEKQYAAMQRQAGALITQLARKGRSAGIHLILAIQRPDTSQLGDHGGALRNNLAARLALGTLDAEGIRMLGISTTDPVAMTLDGTPGRGICVGFGDDPRAGACQVAWLDQRRAQSHVRPAARQGLDAIQPPASANPGQPAGDDEKK